MKIYIGADHNGYLLKSALISILQKQGYDVVDVGDDKPDASDDFPVFAARAVTALKTSDDSDSRAILICGSGQGMLMAANRFVGVRAGLGWSVQAARGIRNDEDSNVLALPSELLKNDPRLVQDIVHAWLTTPFAAAARYKRRNRELDELV